LEENSEQLETILKTDGITDKIWDKSILYIMDSPSFSGNVSQRCDFARKMLKGIRGMTKYRFIQYEMLRSYEHLFDILHGITGKCQELLIREKDAHYIQVG
jgi:hypothetical protein